MEPAQHTRPGESGQGSNGSSNACIACRKVKMKCQLLEGSRCARCERKSLDCVFFQHRRGRKLGMRVGDRLAAGRTIAQRGDVSAPEGPDQTTSTTTHTVSAPRSDFWSDRRIGLEPPSLLNRQAAKGAFSLQNVLRVETQPGAKPSRRQSVSHDNDPIVVGLLNQAIAASLFEG